ncbi:N-6 DNA methylase [Conexibacter arvalis]|uniref:site-specific DNA-methyltransferase (adenine-specific) n=1 Tax=Conexibacter arvalis TaxID=912552 RepID=A0A840IIH9_9ACTN|nr:type I restriction enzyme M protein [Conexibacter arvalis]
MKQHADIPEEKILFDAADALRGSVESAQYKHLVLGLVFLKYVSDTFAVRRAELDRLSRDPETEWFLDDEADRAALLEERDEYESENVFWVPREARWDAILALGSQPDLGVQIDRALEVIERENPPLRDALPKIYARAAMSPETLGKLVSTIAQIGFGDDPDEARDVLGRVYEYFIKEFARREGHRGGEFYTPANVVRLLVEMLEPYRGRIFDPACGSCGMFIQSAAFIKAHAGRPEELSIYGQEMNQATWRIGRMNLAIHGLGGDVKLANSLLDDQHQTLKADFVIANPPFNQKRWGASSVKDDVRWKWGLPPDGNANYAWIQHFASHLAPDGRAGFVLANGSLTSTRSGEGAIREALIRDDLVDCIVALPSGLFYTTGIPVCLWFLDRNKASSGERDRRGEILFIDARSMGQRISRTQIELGDEELRLIVDTYHAWRGQAGAGEYEDEPGFAASVRLTDVEAATFTLSPGRYVGAPEEEEDEIAFEERMAELVERLEAEMLENARLAGEVRAALRQVGYVE